MEQHIREFVERTGRAPESVHLGKNIIEALQDLSSRGVWIANKQEYISRPDSGYGFTWEYRIQVNIVAYERRTAQLTLEKLGDIMAEYPGIGSPAEVKEGVLFYTKDINGINPIRERVWVSLS